jgi:hypothetical protein
VIGGGGGGLFEMDDRVFCPEKLGDVFRNRIFDGDIGGANGDRERGGRLAANSPEG